MVALKISHLQGTGHSTKSENQKEQTNKQKSKILILIALYKLIDMLTLYNVDVITNKSF